MLQHSLSIHIRTWKMSIIIESSLIQRDDQNHLIMCLGKEDNVSCSERHCLLFSSSICMISLQDGKGRSKR